LTSAETKRVMGIVATSGPNRRKRKIGQGERGLQNPSPHTARQLERIPAWLLPTVVLSAAPPAVNRRPRFSLAPHQWVADANSLPRLLPFPLAANGRPPSCLNNSGAWRIERVLRAGKIACRKTMLRAARALVNLKNLLSLKTKSTPPLARMAGCSRCRVGFPRNGGRSCLNAALAQ